MGYVNHVKPQANPKRQKETQLSLGSRRKSRGVVSHGSLWVENKSLGLWRLLIGDEQRAVAAAALGREGIFLLAGDIRRNEW